MKDKVESYIGFAIKKGAAVFGCDGIKQCKRHMQVILYTESLSENSLSSLTSVAERVGCKLLCVPDYDVLRKRSCKALAVCDKSLADAIISNLM